MPVICRYVNKTNRSILKVMHLEIKRNTKKKLYPFRIRIIILWLLLVFLQRKTAPKQ